MKKVLLVVILAAIALGACGKQDSPRPPVPKMEEKK
jgi:hypothetical protein